MTLLEMVEQAAKEGWVIRPSTLEARPIVDEEGTLAGFYCPHPAGRGRLRVGPIYVDPAKRGQGLALQAYSWAPPDTRFVAYVHKDNHPSRRLHERAGFRFWYATKGGEYWCKP